MALLDDILSGWGTTVLVGISVAIAAPIVLPAVGAIVRPVAKLAIKGGLFVVDAMQGLVAEGAEQVNDLVVEARAEYTSSGSISAS
jgi:hypothetical protein